MLYGCCFPTLRLINIEFIALEPFYLLFCVDHIFSHALNRKIKIQSCCNHITMVKRKTKREKKLHLKALHDTDFFSVNEK